MPYVPPTIFAATIGPMRQMARICFPAHHYRVADLALGLLSFHLDCPEAGAAGQGRHTLVRSTDQHSRTSFPMVRRPAALLWAHVSGE